MNMAPEDKKKTLIYGGVAAVLLLAALYFAFLRGGGGGEEVTPELEDRVAEIGAGMQTPQPTAPEIPPESRPQRGPPVAPR